MYNKLKNNIGKTMKITTTYQAYIQKNIIVLTKTHNNNITFKQKQFKIIKTSLKKRHKFKIKISSKLKKKYSKLSLLGLSS